MNKKINITLTLASMLAHFGEEKLSTTSLARVQEFAIDGKKIKIPVYSGNAFRGQCRRLIMDDFLKLAEIEAVSAKMYHTLFAGGALVSGLSLSSMEDKRKLFEMIPPLALLGTALGDAIFQGKCQFGICYPVCKELNEFNSKQSDVSYRTYISDTFHTRRDDTKSKVLKLSDEKQGENPVQMKYDFEGLVAGTELETSVNISEFNDVELSCLNRMLKLFRDNEYIGGKSSIGYGKFKFEADAEIDEDTIYLDYINEKKTDIQKYVLELSKKLK